MRLLVLLAVLLVPTLTHAQARGSILDDPDFLKNMGVDPEPVNVSSPPCESCRDSEASAHIMPFARDRRNGFTLLQNENLPGAPCINNRYYFRNSPSDRVFSGVSLCQQSGSMSRDLWFTSIDGSREGTFMYFQDSTRSLDSQNEKVQVLLLPRVSIPNARVVGNEIHLTLSTGELVVLNATTKAHIRGPLRFGTLSARNAITPYTYSGPGIQISSQHNLKMPFEAGATSTVRVRQGTRECAVPRQLLFGANGSSLQVSDTAMVSVINQNCQPRPAQPFRLP